MLWIMALPLRVEVLAHHFGGFGREAKELDTTASTPFAEGRGFLVASSRSPVSHGQLQDFSNTSPRLIGDPDHDLVPQAQMSTLKPTQQMEVQLGIINRVWNPLLLNQAKVVLGRMPELWCLDAAHLWHWWPFPPVCSFLAIELLGHMSHRIDEGMSVRVAVGPTCNMVEVFEGCKKDTNGAWTMDGQHDHFMQALSSHFTAQFMEEVVADRRTHGLWFTIPAIFAMLSPVISGEVGEVW